MSPPPVSDLDQLAAAVSSTPQGYLPAGRFRPMVNAPGAVAAMVCGIVGIFLCGIILGIVAIVLGVSANNRIRQNPRSYLGGGMATAGIVLGIIAIAAQVLVLIFFLGNRR